MVVIMMVVDRGQLEGSAEWGIAEWNEVRAPDRPATTWTKIR